MVGSSLSVLLKLFGRNLVAAVVHNNLWMLKIGFRILAPFYSRDPRWADMMNRDLSRTTLESFLLSIASLRQTDLRPYLPQIKVPTMGMFGDKDIVVSPNQWKPMQEGISDCRIERFHNAGHFIMLDEPQTFMDTLQDFLSSPNKVETPATEPAPPEASTVEAKLEATLLTHSSPEEAQPAVVSPTHSPNEGSEPTTAPPTPSLNEEAGLAALPPEQSFLESEKPAEASQQSGSSETPPAEQLSS
jgi:hypothetical protein